MSKTRYILMNYSTEIGRSLTINGIAKLVGCTKAHIYHSYKPSEGKLNFNFLRVEYTIIDKLNN